MPRPEGAVSPTSAESVPLLELQNVSKSFGGVHALFDVSANVERGAVVGLIGPNGAGKTTLFNIVSGLVPADAGSIRVDGAEVASWPPHRRAALGIARSFQNPGLMPDETVAANVLVALHRSAPYTGTDVLLRPWRTRRGEQELDARCSAALARFGLTIDRDRRVADLSFAETRFVELAAVAAEEPRLLLLDEPTTGLDPAEVAELTAVLRELRESGVTVVAIAHDVGFVMTSCDDVFVLAEGQVLFHGPPREVQTEPAVIAAYLGSSV